MELNFREFSGNYHTKYKLKFVKGENYGKFSILFEYSNTNFLILKKSSSLNGCSKICKSCDKNVIYCILVSDVEEIQSNSGIHKM